MRTSELATLLDEVNGGVPGAFSRLVEMVYDHFRAMAYNALREEGATMGTLGVTALTHDALIEIGRQRSAWKNEDQFFALATRFMFRIIEQHQRTKRAKKRGSGAAPEALDDHNVPADAPSDEADEGVMLALRSLHEAHPLAAEVFTLREIAGLEMAKIATSLNMPLSTVEKRYRLARAHVRDACGGGPD